MEKETVRFTLMVEREIDKWHTLIRFGETPIGDIRGDARTTIWFIAFFTAINSFKRADMKVTMVWTKETRAALTKEAMGIDELRKRLQKLR
jgi:hypothetical protein